MAKTSKKVSQDQEANYLREQYLEPTSGVVGTGQFYSEITNRAPIVDPSKDLKPKFGIKRIQTQDFYKIEDESGPNGDSVWGAVNDDFGQIRFSGNLNPRNDSNGAWIEFLSVGDFVEITFYGTGLNFLTSHDTVTRGIGVYVDGVLDNTVTVEGSTVLNGRNYDQNQVTPAISGLPLGIHTVKLQLDSTTANMIWYGFEIINERSDLLIPEGDYYQKGKLLRHLSEESIAYDSGFENEYGTPGTKGGRVSVYLNDKGQIKKDIQYTDSSVQYLANTDHSNEEIAGKYSFREFGRQRADDLTTLVNSASDRAFVLDDGTTSLVSNDAVASDSNSVDSYEYLSGNASDHVFTFVGTGLDVSFVTGAGLALEDIDIYVDGLLVGSYGGDGIDATFVKKICSGLPYGTHTVKIDRANTGNFLGIREFIVYQPKTPELSESYVQVGSYNLLADYVVNTTSGPERVSSGVVRKYASREFIFQNGAQAWQMTAIQPARFGGLGPFTNDGNGGYFEYTFFGTGADLRLQTFSNRLTDADITINGTLLTSANFPSVSVSSSEGDIGINLSTGKIDINSAGVVEGASIGFEGLSLGLHTVRVTGNNAGILNIDGIDVITPIYSPKLNGPYVKQNALRSGSNSIKSDIKLLKDIASKQVLTCNLISNTNYTNTNFPGTPTGANVTFELKEPKKVSISINGGFDEANCQLVGVIDSSTQYPELLPASRLTIEGTLNGSLTVELGAGTHTAQLFVRVLGSTPLAFAGRTYIRVEEVE